jgi:hypothetical protein
MLQVDVSANERLRLWYHILCAEEARGARSGQATEPSVRPDAVAGFMRDAVVGTVTGIAASVNMSHSKATPPSPESHTQKPSCDPSQETAPRPSLGSRAASCRSRPGSGG